MNLAHRLAALLIICLSWQSPTNAASYSTDQSDLWWADPPGSENGWGIQFVQRNSTIFATMFVYGPSGSPTWYVSTMTPTGGSGLSWSGSLYATTGPWFGVIPYNSNLFTANAAGTMVWTNQSQWTGTLAYTVNGVSVTKNLTRQTLVNENYAGHFAGALHVTASGCVNSAFNGTSEAFGTLIITQNGSSLSMQTAESGAASCAYVGTLTQYGQGGDVRGSYTCTDGTGGTFEFYELQVTERSIVGHFRTVNTIPAGCQQAGWFGGISATTF